MKEKEKKKKEEKKEEKKNKEEEKKKKEEEQEEERKKMQQHLLDGVKKVQRIEEEFQSWAEKAKNLLTIESLGICEKVRMTDDNICPGCRFSAGCDLCSFPRVVRYWLSKEVTGIFPRKGRTLQLDMCGGGALEDASCRTHPMSQINHAIH